MRSGRTYYYARRCSNSIVQLRAVAHWKVAGWKFEQNRAVPEIGDVRTFEGEYPGLGAVKTRETLRKYINTDGYYEHEYDMESNILPGVEGYVGNLTVFSDVRAPEKSFVVYKATWDKGEIGDAFRMAHKGIIDSIATSTSCSPFTLMPTSGGGLYYARQLTLPLAETIQRVNWKVAGWEFKPERDVPEVGDVRKFQGDYPGLGAVKTCETLKKFNCTEGYYEHEYHMDSNIIPGVEGYIGNFTVFADTLAPRGAGNGRCITRSNQLDFQILRA